MAPHQLLRQHLPDTLEERQAVVVVMAEITDGRDRGVFRRDGNGQRRDVGQSAVLEGTLKDRALVELVLPRQPLDFEVVQHG